MNLRCVQVTVTRNTHDAELNVFHLNVPVVLANYHPAPSGIVYSK